MGVSVGSKKLADKRKARKPRRIRFGPVCIRLSVDEQAANFAYVNGDYSFLRFDRRRARRLRDWLNKYLEWVEGRSEL